MGDVSEDAILDRGNGAGQDEQQEKEWKVLVTGYGPFLEKYPINSSWTIVSTLPAHLPATRTTPAITLIKHLEPIKVAYSPVRSLIPKLLTHSSNPDIILHLGLAAGRTFYTLERQSPCGPYNQKRDVDGQIFTPDEDDGLWATCPNILKPTFDTEDVWRRWRTHLQPLGDAADARLSDDPGTFLCGFIYYGSMAWCLKHRGGIGGERPVMFLHVPDCPTDDHVEVGRQVAIGLVRALVESRVKKGVVEPLRDLDENVPMGAAEI